VAFQRLHYLLREAAVASSLGQAPALTSDSSVGISLALINIKYLRQAGYPHKPAW